MKMSLVLFAISLLILLRLRKYPQKRKRKVKRRKRNFLFAFQTLQVTKMCTRVKLCSRTSLDRQNKLSFPASPSPEVIKLLNGLVNLATFQVELDTSSVKLGRVYTSCGKQFLQPFTLQVASCLSTCELLKYHTRPLYYQLCVKFRKSVLHGPEGEQQGAVKPNLRRKGGKKRELH